MFLIEYKVQGDDYKTSKLLCEIQEYIMIFMIGVVILRIIVELLPGEAFKVKKKK